MLLARLPVRQWTRNLESSSTYFGSLPESIREPPCRHQSIPVEDHGVHQAIDYDVAVVVEQKREALHGGEPRDGGQRRTPSSSLLF
jgi:hypothetical protein